MEGKTFRENTVIEKFYEIYVNLAHIMQILMSFLILSSGGLKVLIRSEKCL